MSGIPKPSNRDWPNGNYTCKCPKCGLGYHGPKRSPLCKVCNLAATLKAGLYVPYQKITVEIQWHAVWGHITDLYGVPCVGSVEGRQIFPTSESANAFLDDTGWYRNKYNGQREKGSYTLALVEKHEERDPSKWVET